MAHARYDIHRERTDDGDDAWSLVFRVEIRAWVVEHLWRRRHPQRDSLLLVAKEQHTIAVFAQSQTGRRLSTHLRLALLEAGLPSLSSGDASAQSARLH